MDITPQIPQNRNVINSYGEKGFEIKEQFYKKTIILDSKNIEEVHFDSVNADFRQFLNQNIEILLIGTGKNHQMLDFKTKNEIKKDFPNISINEMTTDSACRTYNILVSEDREVLAILFPIKDN